MGGPYLEIVEASVSTTVQDLGRPGLEALGVPAGGPADPEGFFWANRLAANPPQAAALEATLTGLAVRLTVGTWVATTGAWHVSVDGQPRPPWAGFWLPAGALLRLRDFSGARAYLAVAGGIAVEPVLGSRSTNLLSGFGGGTGRALEAGDRLPFCAVPPPEAPGRVWRHPDPPRLPAVITLRLIWGPRHYRFADTAFARLLSSEYRVSPHSDRVGIRLEGPALPAVPDHGRQPSEAMPVGGLQVPPDGRPILLMPDRGTTGGYPLLACVASMDFARLGQLRPGHRVRFTAVPLALAQALRRARGRHEARRQPVVDPLGSP